MSVLFRAPTIWILLLLLLVGGCNSGQAEREQLEAERDRLQSLVDHDDRHRRQLDALRAERDAVRRSFDPGGQLDDSVVERLLLRCGAVITGSVDLPEETHGTLAVERSRLQIEAQGAWLADCLLDALENSPQVVTMERWTITRRADGRLEGELDVAHWRVSPAPVPTRETTEPIAPSPRNRALREDVERLRGLAGPLAAEAAVLNAWAEAHEQGRTALGASRQAQRQTANETRRAVRADGNDLSADRLPQWSAERRSKTRKPPTLRVHVADVPADVLFVRLAHRQQILWTGWGPPPRLRGRLHEFAPGDAYADAAAANPEAEKSLRIDRVPKGSLTRVDLQLSRIPAAELLRLLGDVTAATVIAPAGLPDVSIAVRNAPVDAVLALLADAWNLDVHERPKMRVLVPRGSPPPGAGGRQSPRFRFDVWRSTPGEATALLRAYQADTPSYPCGLPSDRLTLSLRDVNAGDVLTSLAVRSGGTAPPSDAPCELAAPTEAAPLDPAHVVLIGALTGVADGRALLQDNRTRKAWVVAPGGDLGEGRTVIAVRPDALVYRQELKGPDGTTRSVTGTFRPPLEETRRARAGFDPGTARLAATWIGDGQDSALFETPTGEWILLAIAANAPPPRHGVPLGSTSLTAVHETWVELEQTVTLHSGGTGHRTWRLPLGPHAE